MLQELFTQGTLRRTALAVAAADARYDCAADLDATAREFEAMMAQRRFLPAPRVLRHAGEAAGRLVSMRGAAAPQEEALVCPMEGCDGVYFPRVLALRRLLPGRPEEEAPEPESRQPLLPGEGCACGAVNLAAMLQRGEDGYALDLPLLRRTVRTAVHFLDNVIDVSAYPDAQTGRLTRATRRLALGVMGLADVLSALGLPYDSQAGRRQAEDLAALVGSAAQSASCALAQGRGPFPLFRESSRAGGAQRRNGAVTGLFPCGELAAACACAPGVSPAAGQPVGVPALVRMQAAVQKHWDGTVWLPVPFSTKQEMQEACALAYRLGCRSVEMCPAAPAAQAVRAGDIRFCPACGSPVAHEAGRVVCEACGFSRVD